METTVPKWAIGVIVAGFLGEIGKGFTRTDENGLSLLPITLRSRVRVSHRLRKLLYLLCSKWDFGWPCLVSSRRLHSALRECLFVRDNVRQWRFVTPSAMVATWWLITFLLSGACFKKEC